MKAIRLHEAGGRLTVADVPVPACGADDVIIEVAACGLCRSDWHVWSGGWPWENIRPRLPVILGHEVAGTVVDRGVRVHAVSVGDLVAVPFHISCGACGQCRAGYTNLCLDGLYPGSTMDGGFAQFMRVRRADLNCIVLPADTSPGQAASLACRYMTAWRAAAAVGRAAAGETAAVYGCGGLGLALIQILTALGLGVIAVDVRDDTLSLAGRAGAVATVNSRREEPAAMIIERTGGGVHLSFDAVGSAAAACASVRSLRPRGRHVQVGLTGATDAGRVPWPADRIVFAELQILGSIGNPVPDYPPLLNLIARGLLRPADLITRTVTLDEAATIIPAMPERALHGLALALIGPS